MKACPACGTEKAEDEFYPRYAKCKSCILARQRERYRQDTRVREAKKSAAKAWAAVNPDRADKKVKDWCRENPEARRTHKANWRRAHKDQVNAATRRRRARKKGVESDMTAQKWLGIKARYGNRCLDCGKPEPLVKLEADHILPLALGGTDTEDNIQPLCRTCNARKSRTHKDFRPKATEVEHAR